MTRFTYGTTTIILEKVCAYLQRRPPTEGAGEGTAAPFLEILLEGGHTLQLHSQVAISAFTKAVEALGENSRVA